MKLQEFKNKTDNITNFVKFEKLCKEYLKDIKPLTISKLPQIWKNHIFIQKSILKHGDRYDYSKSNYTGSRNKLKIICSIHGLFEQKANDHIAGHNCTKCGKITSDKNRRKSHSEFVKQASMLHSGKYIYLSKYECDSNKIDIYCTKCEHKFSQKVNNHLNGSGCPRCKESKGEKAIAKFLDKHNIEYIREHKFKELGQLRFDFYLPNLNTCIEFNGRQHFVPVKYWGGTKYLEKLQKYDRIKEKYCEDNGINIIQIKYTQYKIINKIMTKLKKV